MKPRDLTVEGREMKGIHFAMEFLTQQNKIVHGQIIDPADRIFAKDKNVLVIGGGDTGSDCVGTSTRQGAKSITQIEILPKPPDKKNEETPWPLWPNILKTSSSHEEGCERRWGLTTKRFVGKNGKLTGAEVMEVQWNRDENGKMNMKEIESTKHVIPCELALLSMGFIHPTHTGLLDDLGVKYDNRGNVVIDENCQSSEKKVFAAGDTVLGASLVVKAIYSGRQAAVGVDQYLRTI
jgi:glutamate synthase (NADPH/NADH) small chain